jgi:hypothetical protein
VKQANDRDRGFGLNSAETKVVTTSPIGEALPSAHSSLKRAYVDRQVSLPLSARQRSAQTRETSAWKSFEPRQAPATAGRAAEFMTGFSDEQERKTRNLQ